MSKFSLIRYPHDETDEGFILEADRTYRLGSRRDNDIVFQQQDVSRHHAILRVGNGTFHITDLKSKNGTFVNGNRTSSAHFRAGDQINLSSSSFVVVDLGEEEGTDGADGLRSDAGAPDDDTGRDTIIRRSLTTAEDVVGLLEITAAAVRNQSLTEPLKWGIRKLGLRAAVILFKDCDDRVAVISSAGDMSPLINNSSILRDIALDPDLDDKCRSYIRHVHDAGEDLLVVPLVEGNLLLMRYEGSPPPVGDAQALAASAEAVLATGSGGGASNAKATGTNNGSVQPESKGPAAEGGSTGGDGLEVEDLLPLPLDEARESFERWYLARILDRCEGNRSQAAREMGMSRAGLFKKMRKLNLES